MSYTLTSGQTAFVNYELGYASTQLQSNVNLILQGFTDGIYSGSAAATKLVAAAAYFASYQTYLQAELAGTTPFNPNYPTYGTPVGAGGSGGFVVCYLAGTNILTDAGEVAVEQLSAGDHVMTLSGAARPIRWVGHRQINLSRHPAPEQVQPIRVRADAFAPGVPHRDLLLSPEHALLCDGVLIPVRLLVNGASIVRDTSFRSATYYHVELDSHDIMLAENLPAESYLDTGNRGLFQNAGLPMVLHPDLTNDQGRREAESCAPFADEPAVVEPIWRALAERAGQIGWTLPAAPVVTADPALHINVDGRSIAPVSFANGRYTFVLPRADATVRLISRDAVPSATRPWIADDRHLGVLVRSLTLRSGGSVQSIALDNPALTDGWWAAEWHNPTALRRWTNGNAALPVAQAGLPASGPCLLEVEVAETQAYVLPVANDADARVRIAA
jgi:hypothetical protein